MKVQTIELAGQRFVILPESEFQELERRLLDNGDSRHAKAAKRPRFEPVTPFDVHGESASEMLIRERR